jgi:hypothetical protein
MTKKRYFSSYFTAFCIAQYVPTSSNSDGLLAGLYVQFTRFLLRRDLLWDRRLSCGIRIPVRDAISQIRQQSYLGTS